jgi:hypothetical protein
MTLRIGELLEVLQELVDEHGPETEIRLAHQPQWAFEYSLDPDLGVVENDDGSTVIYLAEGQQLGYLPHTAAVAVGWAEAREDDEDEEDR